MRSAQILQQDEQAFLAHIGFTPEHITRFRLYRTGLYQRDGAAERRLKIARWSYQHGKLSAEFPGQYSKRAYERDREDLLCGR